MQEKRLTVLALSISIVLFVIWTCGLSQTPEGISVSVTQEVSRENGFGEDHQMPNVSDEQRGELFVSKIFGWFQSYIIHIMILAISLAVILFTVSQFIKKREGRRFLTTTRLSILHKQVQRACRYIETNYSDKDLSVQKVCEELVTGEAFLEALFQKDLGIGVVDFINQVRVNSVKNLLSNDPVASEEMMCEESGYTELDELEKSFRKITGVSIGDYAENIRTKMSDTPI